MKKERTKRICNYFMKGLLLCALVFGFWFMADAGVNADEVGIPKNFTPGTIEMVPFTKGENKMCIRDRSMAIQKCIIWTNVSYQELLLRREL